jgi:hypothetical protein
MYRLDAKGPSREEHCALHVYTYRFFAEKKIVDDEEEIFPRCHNHLGTGFLCATDSSLHNHAMCRPGLDPAGRLYMIILGPVLVGVGLLHMFSQVVVSRARSSLHYSPIFFRTV